MSQVSVADVGEISEGERKIISVEGTSIGVFNVDGEFYALKNECRHQGGPACTGRFGGKLVEDPGEPGERGTERISDQMVVTCPWHGWEYDVKSGKHIGNDDIELPTYDVVVEDGEILVDV